MNVVEFSQPLQSVCIQLLLFFIFVPKCHEDLFNFSDNKVLACSTGDAHKGKSVGLLSFHLLWGLEDDRDLL